jgi:imidazolonepropionase-like amidohydrolase
MNKSFFHSSIPLLLVFLLFVGCERGERAGAPVEGAPITAFVGARLIDGTGSAPLENSVILVQNGRIQAVGAQGSVEIPDAAERVDLTGRTVIPGLVNTHAHAGNVRGLETGHYSRENVLDQLGLYARYGVTTVVSLGDDQQATMQLRDEQSDPRLDRARIFAAGTIITARTPEEAQTQVQQLSQMQPDWVKIRIDSQLGAQQKMSPETYQTVIEEAHRLGIPVAVHVVELEDAKGALRAGADFVGHSVRDQPVDEEMIALMRERRICLSPTLTRELSTFVYEERPDFFDDPFFQREVDPAIMDALQDPERQQAIRQNRGAQYWKAQLPLAMQNLKTLSDAGVGIAMGTDTGAPTGRFQGYFEHLELEMMAQAGLSPMQVIVAATGGAARCVGLDQEVGTIEPGKFADLIVLEGNPLEDIRNTRTIESVWISGNRVQQQT